MIFKDLGLSSTTTALFAQGVYGIVKVVTCLIFVFFLADSLGRRMSFMWSGMVQALCMFFLGFVRLFTHSHLLTWRKVRSLTKAYSMFGSAQILARIRVLRRPALPRLQWCTSLRRRSTWAGDQFVSWNSSDTIC